MGKKTYKNPHNKKKLFKSLYHSVQKKRNNLFTNRNSTFQNKTQQVNTMIKKTTHKKTIYIYTEKEHKRSKKAIAIAEYVKKELKKMTYEGDPKIEEERTSETDYYMSQIVINGELTPYGEKLYESTLDYVYDEKSGEWICLH